MSTDTDQWLRDAAEFFVAELVSGRRGVHDALDIIAHVSLNQNLLKVQLVMTAGGPRVTATVLNTGSLTVRATMGGSWYEADAEMPDATVQHLWTLVGASFELPS